MTRLLKTKEFIAKLLGKTLCIVCHKITHRKNLYRGECDACWPLNKLDRSIDLGTTSFLKPYRSINAEIMRKYRLPKSKRTGKDFHRLYFSKHFNSFQRALVITRNYRWVVKHHRNKCVRLVIDDWHKWCTKMINTSQKQWGSLKSTREERIVWKMVREGRLNERPIR